MPTPLVVSIWIKVCLAGMASTATCTLVYPIPFTQPVPCASMGDCEAHALRANADWLDKHPGWYQVSSGANNGLRIAPAH